MSERQPELRVEAGWHTVRLAVPAGDMDARAVELEYPLQRVGGQAERQPMLSLVPWDDLLDQVARLKAEHALYEAAHREGVLLDPDTLEVEVVEVAELEHPVAVVCSARGVEYGRVRFVGDTTGE